MFGRLDVSSLVCGRVVLWVTIITNIMQPGYLFHCICDVSLAMPNQLLLSRIRVDCANDVSSCIHMQ